MTPQRLGRSAPPDYFPDRICKLTMGSMRVPYSYTVAARLAIAVAHSCALAR